jgi:hypothetical protein
MKSSKFLLAVAATGAMLVGLAGTARAQRWDACSARVQNDQQDLDRAIDRFGYNSGQARHERAELQRDAANCGYGDGRYDGDRDGWRYDNHGGHEQVYRDYNSAFDNGYRDGVAMGERDAQRNRAFRPNKNDWYEDADRGYNGAYGDKNFYKRQYRQAFEQGYSEGYQRWR